MEYVVKLCREIHEYPEIGFDLPKTLAVVRRELDAMGIPYTEEYGPSSIVATINPAPFSDLAPARMRQPPMCFTP